MVGGNGDFNWDLEIESVTKEIKIFPTKCEERLQNHENRECHITAR